MTSPLSNEIVSKLPEDYKHVTINNLMPVVTTLMSHAAEIDTLDGPGRKELVISCIDLIVQRLPFPENEILKPIVKAVVPPACDAICIGVKKVELDIKDIMSRDRLQTAFQRVMDRKARPALRNMAPPTPPSRLQGWLSKIRIIKPPVTPPKACVMRSNPVYTPAVSRFI